MLGRLRARATAALGLIWAAVFGTVGLSMELWAVLRYRPAFRLVVLTDVLRYAAAWSIAGAICGVAFAIAVAFARRRSLERLPSVRICTLAAFAGFAIGATTDPGYRAAILLGIVAAGLAFGSILLAKHPNPEATAS